MSERSISRRADLESDPHEACGCGTERGLGSRLARAVLLAPILVYRVTFSSIAGSHCRYLPSCSAYAKEAIETNGAWRGFWLALARLCRCHPFGASGYDPVPDISGERHRFAPWRYGRWRLSSAPKA